MRGLEGAAASRKVNKGATRDRFVSFSFLFVSYA